MDFEQSGVLYIYIYLYTFMHACSGELERGP